VIKPCSMHREMRNLYRISVAKPERRPRHLQDNKNCIIRKECEVIYIYIYIYIYGSGSVQGLLVACCEHGNELYGSREISLVE
jgi:hypothetical protein